MPVIIDYLLKLSICLTVVYLFYFFVLQRLTFYNWNRWYLLGYTALSFIIPLVDIMPSLQRKELYTHQLVQWVPVLGFSAAAEHRGLFAAMGLWDWIAGACGAGMLFLLVRFFVKLAALQKISKKATRISTQAPHIYQLNTPVMPFSFGNSIYINMDMHSGDELEEIIRHEFVHVKQRHTMDMLWSEWLCIVNWYNPFVWLLRHAIRQNLEFIADDKVVQQGYDKTEYQYLLLKVIGNREFAFASNFNFSSLKKRIIMMNTVKTAKVHVIKFLFLLPVVAVLLLSFRKEMVKHQRAIHKEPAGVAAMLLQQSSEEHLKGDTIPASGNETKQNAVTIKLKDVQAKPLYIINGTPADESVLKTIPAESIESVEVIKNASATALYGSRGANGVVLIVTKMGNAGNSLKDSLRLSFVAVPDKNKESTSPENGGKKVISSGQTAVGELIEVGEGNSVPVELAGKVSGLRIMTDTLYYRLNAPEHNNNNILIGPGADQKPLYIVDGKWIDNIEQLKPDQIKSISVLKGAPAKTEYGEEGKNGVVIITLKSQTGNEVKAVQGQVLQLKLQSKEK